MFRRQSKVLKILQLICLIRTVKMIYLFTLQELQQDDILSELNLKHQRTAKDQIRRMMRILLQEKKKSKTFFVKYYRVRFNPICLNDNSSHSFIFILRFQQDAFINRKVKETRKRSRLTKAFNSNSSNILQSFTKPPRNATEKQSQELVKPISNLLNQVVYFHQPTVFLIQAFWKIFYSF